MDVASASLTGLPSTSPSSTTHGIGAEHDAGVELRRSGPRLPLSDLDRLGFGIEPGIDDLRRMADDGPEWNAELSEEGDTPR